VTLGQRIVALHEALAASGIAHAFGGALALAFWVQEPRGTRDIDVNAFVPAAEWQRILAALPDGVAIPDAARRTLERDAQVRLWWDDTPVDLFLDYADLHAQAAREARSVPFAGTQIPVLGPVELAAFKAMFDRPKDWVDIGEMLAAGTLDPEALRRSLRPMLAGDDPRWDRLDEAVRYAASR
jgi:hypothetical protein